MRKLFAKHGYSFSVPEYNTSRKSACCLAHIEHPVRERTKEESSRSFKARLKKAPSVKAKEELEAFGKLTTKAKYEAYSCSQCSRCRRTHARDTSSADLITFAGICSMATGRRPAALCPQRAAS